MCDITVKCYGCESKKVKYDINYIGLDISKENYWNVPFLLSFPSFKYGFYNGIYIYKYKCSNGHLFSSTLTTK